MSDEAVALVLVVIADADLRQLVGSIVAQMDLPAPLMPTWRAAVLATTEPPSCIVADLDHIIWCVAGVAVLRKNWDATVPLIVLSRHPNVAEQAAGMGPLAGIRKPMNVGALMDAIRWAVERENP